MEQFYTILTEIGKAKIANATVLGEKVNLTKFQVGDGNGQYYNPSETQTALKNKVWESNITSITTDENNPSWVIIFATIPGNVGGFTIREAGVFDTEGNLIAVSKLPETYKPTADNGSTKDLTIKIILEVSNAEVVTIKVDPTVILSSKKDLQVLETKMNTKINTTKEDLEKKIEKVATDLGKIELTGNKVTIEDTDNNFKSGTVEGALQELATKDKALDTRIDDNKTEVDEKIADLKQCGSNVKERFATVITSKGVTTDSSDTFETMINNVGSIKTKLPILEGDVGVAEDKNGNIYNIPRLTKNIYYNTRITQKNLYVKDIPSYDIYILDNGDILTRNLTGVTRYDGDGNQIWKYETGNVTSIITFSDDDIYAFTAYTIEHIDGNGELVWKTNISNPSLFKKTRHNDGYYAIGRSSSDGRTKYLRKMRMDGTQIWQVSYAYLSYLVESPNGNLYGSTYYLWDDNIGNIEFIDRINPDDGGNIWRRTAHNPIVFDTTEDNGVLVCYDRTTATNGLGGIRKFDEDGTTVWYAQAEKPIKKFRQDYEGNIYFDGIYQMSNSDLPVNLLTAIDKNGNTIGRFEDEGKNINTWELDRNNGLIYAFTFPTAYSLDKNLNIYGLNNGLAYIYRRSVVAEDGGVWIGDTLSETYMTKLNTRMGIIVHESSDMLSLVGLGGRVYYRRGYKDSVVKIEDNYKIEDLAILDKRGEIK